MENYQLGDILTIEANLFNNVLLDETVVHMKVQGHSRMQNLLGFAMNKIKNESIKQIVWHGEGVALQKATNCAEIMKRKNKNLYMLTRKGYKRMEEYWEPIESDRSLDRLKVNRDTETVGILLSKLPLDNFKHEQGYLGVEDVPNINRSSEKSPRPSNERKTPRTRPRQRNHRPQKHFPTSGKQEKG